MPKSFLDSSSTEKMSETVVDFINHYKKSIEKHSEDRERVSKQECTHVAFKKMHVWRKTFVDS